MCALCADAAQITNKQYYFHTVTWYMCLVYGFVVFSSAVSSFSFVISSIRARLLSIYNFFSSLFGSIAIAMLVCLFQRNIYGYGWNRSGHRKNRERARSRDRAKWAIERRRPCTRLLAFDDQTIVIILHLIFRFLLQHLIYIATWWITTRRGREGKHKICGIDKKQ